MENSDLQSLRILVCSYNLPEETDAIYAKLISDGFDPSSILVIDNGSDKYPPARSAKLLLPYNIRFTGQARIGLEYLMDYFPARNYWLISTSARLEDDINYKRSIEKALTLLKPFNPGIISHSFKKDPGIYSYIYKNPEERQRYESQFAVQSWSEEKTRYDAGLIDGWLQIISTVFSHEVLLQARAEGNGFWNRDLYRGWGVSAEMIYTANKMGLNALVLYDSHVTWIQNKTYRENKDVESIMEYRSRAAAEEKEAFKKRYGVHSYLLFRSWFLRAAYPYRNEGRLLKDFKKLGMGRRFQAVFPLVYSRYLSRFF